MTQLETYNVVWDSPSEKASGSMPLGNGDLAANVWVEKNGDLLLLFAKTDAWDENSINLKLGRVRVKLSPSPFVDGVSFRQTLELRTGEIEIAAGDVAMRIWIDANHPVVRVEVESKKEVEVQASLEMWRTKEYEVQTHTGDIFKNLDGPDPFPTVISPDHLFPGEKDRVVWCHYNEKREHDGYEINMRLQGLGGFLNQIQHPLLGRTFGAAMQGEDLVSVDSTTLKSISPSRQHHLEIHALTMRPASIEQWGVKLDEMIAATDAVDVAAARQAHEKWWTNFWDRSWIYTSDFHVTQGYILQRFMNAAAGRGAMPIKFNGSLFTYGEGDDPDYRRWGGPGFWFQNQRLVYWPMIAAGDGDTLMPWLKMYRDQLELQRYRTRTYFNHAGAHYPETVMFWGAEVSGHYGWTPFEKRTEPEAECAYLKYYWTGGLELVLMMLEYFEQTEDEKFAREMLLPVAEAVIEFFDLHWPRDAQGKIHFEPAQSLETWHEATNPLPEIAGLKYLLTRLLAAFPPSPCTQGEGRGEGSSLSSTPATKRPSPYPSPGVPGEGTGMEANRQYWTRILSELRPIPLGEKEGKRIILPAEKFDRKKNTENPELYSIFPYRLFGVGKPDLQLARDTFAARSYQLHECWSQDEVQMALLGLTEQAKEYLIQRAAPVTHSESRFPAFWDSFHDWKPDMDHGGVLQLAQQAMLMQCEGKKILLLPAWPKEWDADFKLHAPHRTIVQGKVRGGKLVELHVEPAERRSDVIISEEFGT